MSREGKWQSPRKRIDLQKGPLQHLVGKVIVWKRSRVSWIDSALGRHINLEAYVEQRASGLVSPPTQNSVCLFPAPTTQDTSLYNLVTEHRKELSINVF
jgi:hypothetical protein